MTGSSGQPEAGGHIGDYVLEARLGGGSFGAVWRAHHTSTGQPVALKLLTGVLANRDRGGMRAEVELLAATASSHSPHVVRVLGGGTEPLSYVVMEYIEGTDLAALLRERGKLPPQETIRIGLGVADALGALKDSGIIHRDVKPANVMLDREGTVKLTDFGIAKIVGYETITMTGQLPMTMAYAAPEVWEGNASHQSDLYALGILLYQCLTGSPPFTGNYGALYRQHTSVPPDLGVLPEETPSSLRELVRLCLEKDPQARPQDAPECQELLRRAEAELGAAYATALKEPERFGPWLKREPYPSQPWAWRCVHESTGGEATVEVHFAHDLAYGTDLRKAVSANPKLAPLGAERLLGTNRLLLRPGEGWHEPPGGEFSFWVAREEKPATAPPSTVTPAMLGKAVEGLLVLVDEAASAGLSLSLAPERVTLLEDGGVHVRRPGLPPAGDGSPMEQALAFLRGLPLEEEARALVASGRDLGGLRTLLGELPEAPAGAPPGPSELGVAHPAEGTGLVGRPEMEETGTYAPPTTMPVAPEPAPTVSEAAALEAAEAGVAPALPGIVLELEPARAGGRFGASYRVRLENRTQTRQSLRVRVIDADEHCRFVLAEAGGAPSAPTQRVSLPPGSSETLHLRVSASSPRLWGRREKRRFTVEASGGDAGPPPTANGEFDEIPYLSGWPPLAGGALLAAGVAFIVAMILLGGGGAGDCGEGPSDPNMVCIPGGTFLLGSDDTSQRGDPLARPAHEVAVDAFEIDRFEVTNLQYKAFLDSKGGQYTAPLREGTEFEPYNWVDGMYPPNTLGDYPVVLVTWEEASAYCAAQGKRLPTEVEWERAARGDDGRQWPWGDTFDASRLNYVGTDHTGSSVSTMSVGSFPGGASPYGVMDMAGNVWEWTADDLKPYPGADPGTVPEGAFKVSRGGSWESDAARTTAFVRNYDPPDSRDPTIGFRCARSVAGRGSPTPSGTPTRVLPLSIIGPTGELLIAETPLVGFPQATGVTGAAHPAWGPGGKRLAFIALSGEDPARAPSELKVLDPMRGRADTVVTASTCEADGGYAVLHNPRWWPDGSALLYQEECPDPTDPQVIRWVLKWHQLFGPTGQSRDDPEIDLRPFDELLGEAADVASFDVSPVDGSLAVELHCRYRAGDCVRLAVLEPGGKARILKEALNGESYGSPSWSPDGVKIAYYYGTESELRVRVLEPRSGKETDLATIQASAQSPVGYWAAISWSPGGRYVVYEQQDAIWMNEVEAGAQPRRLGGGHHPAWSTMERPLKPLPGPSLLVHGATPTGTPVPSRTKTPTPPGSASTPTPGPTATEGPPNLAAPVIVSPVQGELLTLTPEDASLGICYVTIRYRAVAGATNHINEYYNLNADCASDQLGCSSRWMSLYPPPLSAGELLEEVLAVDKPGAYTFKVRACLDPRDLDDFERCGPPSEVTFNVVILSTAEPTDTPVPSLPTDTPVPPPPTDTPIPPPPPTVTPFTSPPYVPPTSTPFTSPPQSPP